ncbi:MAG: phosphatidylglycerophosphatase A family protein [Symbiobacteriia bacterium]
MIERNQPTRELVIEMLHQRGVALSEMAGLVQELQKPYIPDLTHDACANSVERVLDKREVQNAIITGIALDKAAEKGDLDEPLLSILRRDDGLYGIDEIMALSIVNIYGTIGLTNFGFLDKTKPGVIGRLNEEKRPHVNTYLDDLVAAVVAAACSRLAHQARDREISEAAENEVAASKE